MQLSLQAVCAYSDAFPDAIEGKCDVLGEYIESYDDIDVDQDIVPVLKDFIQTFSPKFFTSVKKEVAARRDELHQMIEEEDPSYDPEAKVDTGSTSAHSAEGAKDNQCFDHNYKSYLSAYCVDLRKAGK